MKIRVLLYGISIFSLLMMGNLKPMGFAYQMCESIVEQAPQAIAAATALVLNNNRSDNYLPPMTQQIRYTSETTRDDLSSVSNQVLQNNRK